jgi:hypothetical protein
MASAIIAKTKLAAADDFRRDDFDRDKDKDWHRDRDWHKDKHWHRDFHCFLKGTTVRTADGNRKIEDLAVGDLLPTIFGGISPIQWIGRYRFKKSNREKAWVKQIRPIRIAQSALAPGMPHADLYLTQTHAVLIDGVLVEAGNRRYGPASSDEPLCAPRIYYEYTRGEIKSCFRSAISPWIDRRKKVDIIRDKLDARGIALLRESEFMS